MAGFVSLPLLALVHVLPAQPFWCLPLFAFYWLALFNCRTYFHWRRRHPYQLSADSSSWLLDFPGEEGRIAALLTGEVLVWPWLLVLPFKLTHSGQTYVLICLADTAPGEDLRRLRVQLRTG